MIKMDKERWTDLLATMCEGCKELKHLLRSCQTATHVRTRKERDPEIPPVYRPIASMSRNYKIIEAATEIEERNRNIFHQMERICKRARHLNCSIKTHRCMNELENASNARLEFHVQCSVRNANDESIEKQTTLILSGNDSRNYTTT